MNDYIEFEIRRSSSASQPYYWRILSKSNYKVLASSETYVHKSDCVSAIKLVKAHAATATIWDMTASEPQLVA